MRFAGAASCRALLAVLLGLALLPAAQAHLMVAQRGTLNWVGDGVFMVLSLPVSAFTGVDDDGDGQWSAAELSAHTALIEAQVQRGVQLFAGGHALPLQGLLLQPSAADHAGQAAASQVVVLGRFALSAQRTDLRFKLALFGKGPDEQAQQITVSRGDEAQRLLLTPARTDGELLPGAAATLKDYVAQGIAHVLAGPDHLLFLLVVLASAWGLRPALLALSCFTVGHAITLAASALGGLSVPASLVEPAIALTIVGMALVERWSRRRQRAGARGMPEGVRLTLVFGCALVHGLGLAGALGDLGLDTRHRLWSLAGFNLGVELAQVGVALSVALLMLGLRHVAGVGAPARLARLASLAAVALGAFWFMQRVSGLA